MWSGPKGSSVQDRLDRAQEAKKALLERFKMQPGPGRQGIRGTAGRVEGGRRGAPRARGGAGSGRRPPRRPRRAEAARLKAEREAEAARKAAEEAARTAAEEAAIMAQLKARGSRKSRPRCWPSRRPRATHATRGAQGRQERAAARILTLRSFASRVGRRGSRVPTQTTRPRSISIASARVRARPSSARLTASAVSSARRARAHSLERR